MIELTEHIENRIREHASDAYPDESCGVLVVINGTLIYKRIRNLSEGNGFFMDPNELARIGNRGEILAVVHSHPNLPPIPSMADRVECEKTGLPWVIVNWPTGQIEQHWPDGYKAPLLGRQFSHGALDCFSLARDYYASIGIDIPDYVRLPRWWEHGDDLYMKHYEEGGFRRVDTLPGFVLQEHDAILMQISARVANHVAVYIGNGQIIQHLDGLLSSRDVYGGWYRKCTRQILRHTSL